MEIDDLVRDFIIESLEGLERVDRDLVALEKAPGDNERLKSIFRAIHTIKGTCGFLEFGRLESVAHVGENLLCRLRDGVLTMNADIATALLGMVDAIRSILATIEKTGTDGTNYYADLVSRLTALAEAEQNSPPAVADPSGAIESSAVAASANVSKQKSKRRRKSSDLTGAALAVSETEAATDDVSSTPVAYAAARLSTESAIVAELAIEGGPSTALVEAGVEAPPVPLPAAEATSVALAESNVRVDVGLLDRLMNLVGELVLARNQIIQASTKKDLAAFQSTSQRLNLITSELQENVMKTRMQPIGNVWSKFPRVIRDLEATCGKQARIEMEGESTELDKTIIEAIKDPLTHIIRNSVDHGIEMPAIRVAKGKPARGRINLRAFHEGGQVIIEINDDGGGIDPERIKLKALERGLINRDQAARMTEREALRLIFLPGFSTAEKVTNISGRGVGMDVVKTNIEKIGGAIDLKSVPGQGTSIRIKIPLTLAIIPALIVACGGDRFAIPQASLLELVRLEGEAAMRKIETIHNAPVYRLRGDLLPLVYLHEQLHVNRRQKREDVVNIVVLRADDRSFGLVVDGIHDTEEIVVKPLSKQLKGLAVFAGATIMGDGKVALILDVLGVAQKSGVIGETRDGSTANVEEENADLATPTRRLLVCGIGGHGQIAIPLDAVNRLEDISASRIERSNNREVIQYRGQIMPIVRVNRLLGVESGAIETARMAASGMLKVVVHSVGDDRIGLVVDKIIDIVTTNVNDISESHERGMVGTLVVQGRVTDLVDVPLLLAASSFEPNRMELALT